MKDFADLPLHDAVLRNIEVEWEAKQCRLVITMARKASASTDLCTIEFEGVSRLSIPHDEPWGPSSSINTLSATPSAYQVEMQSGDIIEIQASKFSFKQL